MSTTQNANRWVEAIESIHKIQTLINQADAKLKERKEQISGMLFELAKTCKDVNEFDQRCAYAEEQFKANHKKGTKVPKHWTQIKSNVKAAMRMDINLDDHETESSMRKELNAKRKAAKEQKEKEQVQEENTRSLTPVEQELVKARLLLATLPEDQALEALQRFNQVLAAAHNAPVQPEHTQEKEVNAPLRVANA